MSDDASKARAMRAMLETRLAWKGHKPVVKPPTKPVKINYKPKGK